MDLNKAVWRRASRSTAEGDNCVELASLPWDVVVRDSKDPSGPKLIIGRKAFRDFAKVLKNS